MLPTSTIWPWSSRACAISAIKMDKLKMIFIAFLALALLGSVQASTIQSGQDVQSAINSAKAGDIIIVGSGNINTFEVDKPLTIEGQSGSIMHAALQKPAIKINSDGVRIIGFRIIGVGKDTTAKFNYYMQNPAAASGKRLDQPNSAILVNANNVHIENTIIFGAQAGLKATNADNLTLKNVTLESCESGAALTKCFDGRIEDCSFSNCEKFGLDAEQCSNIVLQGNHIVNTSSAGALIKDSDKCSVLENTFSQNTFGLSLWKTTHSQVLRNQVDHNYYGILITQNSNNNTIADNVAEDNSRSEIVTGFGIGISLQENSSYNVVFRNTATGNFNGLETSKGCKYNAFLGNNATDNKHGIRMNENRNNVIFGNNFYNNNINAYENASLNIWNTTIGNYYSDYQGKDENSDGLGDQSYSIPGQDSSTRDFFPLTRPYREARLNASTINDAVSKYAVYGLAYNEIPVYRKQGDTIVISSQPRTSPPKWSNSQPLDVNAPPY